MESCHVTLVPHSYPEKIRADKRLKHTGPPVCIVTFLPIIETEKEWEKWHKILWTFTPLQCCNNVTAYNELAVSSGDVKCT